MPRRPSDRHLSQFLNPPTQREIAALGEVPSPAPTGRTFGYWRVSTDAQAEDGQSLEVQQRQLEGWAMQRGVTLKSVHVEAGVSGAIPFLERPEGGKLWAELRK